MRNSLLLIAMPRWWRMIFVRRWWRMIVEGLNLTLRLQHLRRRCLVVIGKLTLWWRHRHGLMRRLCIVLLLRWWLQVVLVMLRWRHILWLLRWRHIVWLWWLHILLVRQWRRQVLLR